MQFSEVAEQDVAVLLMDTQGMFDNESTMTLTAQIFGISTLVSSYQIYNVQNSIGEDKLQHLALFSEYGRIALQPSVEEEKEEKEVNDSVKRGKKSSPSKSPAKGASAGAFDANGAGTSTNITGADACAVRESRASQAMAAIRGKTDCATAAAGAGAGAGAGGDISSVALSGKPFQHLLFLVRDWANFETEWNPEAATDTTRHDEITNLVLKLRKEMTQYLATVVAPRDKADLQSTRDQVERCFESVDAWLLPHPGPAVTKRTYDGSLRILDPLFAQLINHLATFVFSTSLEPKRIHNRSVTAPEMLTFFEVYVNVFQEGGSQFPKAMTLLDATADANNRNAYDLAINRYKTHMSDSVNQEGHVSSKKFSDIHDTACNLAWGTFTEIANMGSLHAIEVCSQKLEADILKEMTRFEG